MEIIHSLEKEIKNPGKKLFLIYRSKLTTISILLSSLPFLSMNIDMCFLFRFLHSLNHVKT